jgi:5-oxoprolinase (ATP-hydrolysing)
MDCALLSGHRRIPAYGLKGGEPGELGENSVRRKDGTIEPVGGCDQIVLEAGDAIIIKTPTGGGYGPVSKRGT